MKTPTFSIYGQFYRLLQKLVQNATCVIAIYTDSYYRKLQQSVIKISDWFVIQIYGKHCHSLRQQEKMVLPNATIYKTLIDDSRPKSERDLMIINSRRNVKTLAFLCVFLQENETRIHHGAFCKDLFVSYVAFGLVKIVSTCPETETY